MPEPAAKHASRPANGGVATGKTHTPKRALTTITTPPTRDHAAKSVDRG
jgi:hypothetical protein